ncbi:Zn(II)2Cys6 transcription factor domain-containing protein [Aspergillus undulatus]|uniref:Zn(II)2Cys6 transcription factor domain-containing protein n=1 Tax=Aspergillus undulatus TaxID=1810928 RepID=UPI003CCDC07D
MPTRVTCCRERRTKVDFPCDEQEPSCGTCTRLKRPCEPVRRELKFCTVTASQARDISSQAVSRASDITAVEVQAQAVAGKVQAFDLDLVNFLQHMERDIFYLTYWENACLPAVHLIFRSISVSAWEHPMLKDAIFALSSCNLSRIRSEYRKQSSLDLATFSPSLVRQTRSQLYYPSATRKFMVFTVLVLFTHIESSMGNFQGSQCHVQGLTNFFMELHGVIGDAMLKALLSAWMQVRYVVWWARHLGSLQERRLVVLSIMCESHRLNSKETLDHWGPAVALRDSSSCINPGIMGNGARKPFMQLADQTKKLEEWLLYLPPSEQPLPANPGTSNLDRSNVPLFRLLLRITKGTKLAESVAKNSYTIGFSGLMQATILRCRNASLGTEIQEWLEDLQSLQSTEEGASPVYQTLAVVKAVNQRRNIGREIFAVTLPRDDAGEIPKSTVYNSQSISTLLFHERCRASGELFTNCVRIGP